MYFLTGSWTHEQSFPSSYGAKVGEPKKMKEGGGGEKRRGNSPLPLYSSFMLSSQLSRRTNAETFATQATVGRWGGGVLLSGSF